MHIRPGREADLGGLTDIYNHYVVHSHATFDVESFTVEQRRGWFGQYAPTGPHRLLVGEVDGALVGYATSSRFRFKPAYGGTVETTIYLHPERTGRGLADPLYAALLDELRRGESVHVAVAGVTLPGSASIALHLRHGFCSIGTFSELGYKFGRYIDVQWFQLRIGSVVPGERPQATFSTGSSIGRS